jgi:hypothetical protein
LKHQRGELIQTIGAGLSLGQQGERDQGVRGKQIESRGAITGMGENLVERRLSGRGENVRK